MNNYPETNYQDALNICKIQPKDYQALCFETMTAFLSSIYECRFDEAIQTLDEYPSETYPTIVKGIASSFAFNCQELKSNLTSAIRTCQSISIELQSVCIAGFAGGLLSTGTPGEEYQDAISFCHNEAMDPSNITTCERVVASYIRDSYPKEKQKIVCDILTSTERELCQN